MNIVMNIVGYCRVSTEKSDQLNSMEAQKLFFEEYAKKNNYNLVKLYADEGISGTKTKNRKEFLQLMQDAKHEIFDMVIVKDISRFARNTVDLLNSTRQLKALNIETLFLTSNMTVLGNSEFVLTIFAALAQEESANMSKRVKFGKKLNAEKGRVPTMVYGYDKTIGDYFNLSINKDEAIIVRRIFNMYINQGYGALKIARILNSEGLKTKRDCDWSQNGISHILSNELYAGKIINGKEEVEDFLTGVRRQKDETEWIVTNRPDLCIVEPELFEQVKKIRLQRCNDFHINRERQSNKHLFSTLIKCADCGYSFRRTEHLYKNTYIRWVCSGRNTNGVKSCNNKTKIDEDELIETLREYFTNILIKKDDIIRYVIKEFIRIYKSKNDNENQEKDLNSKLSKTQKSRQKYMDMYTDDLISREELRERVNVFNTEIERLENEIKLISYSINKSDQLGHILNQTFKTIGDIVSIEYLTNAQLKQIIQKIVVDSDGKVDIYLRLFGNIGLDETFLISDNSTQGSYREALLCKQAAVL